jgi:chromosome segregation protein
MEHAAAARTRIGEHLAKLDIERTDLDTEARRAEDERVAAEDALRRAREALETLHVDRVARESELGVARGRRDALGRELRSREHELAGVIARLKSLEEIDAARAEYGEGARIVLAESGGDVSQLGSVADHLDVDERYELAVEACLGDLLQHVVVQSHEHASAGLAFARERSAGRVGFVIAGSGDQTDSSAGDLAAPAISGVTRLSSVVRIDGPAATIIRHLCDGAFIAETREAAYAASEHADAPIATLDGEVFRGRQRVEGGVPAETRTILATKREIKQLREHADAESAALVRMREDAAGVDVDIAGVESTIASLQAELHRQEKAIVAFELQLAGANESADRVRRKQDQISVERRTADQELETQEARRQEAQESIQRIELEQRAADEQLSAAQRRLFEARETAENEARRTAEAKAEHAALVERTNGLLIEIQRLEEASRELEERAVARAEDLKRNHARCGELQAAIEESERQLVEDLRTFDDLREAVRVADEASQTLRASFDVQEQTIREARRALELVRAEAAHLDVERATAESDLTHLASACVENVQATLDEVAAEVAQMENDGVLASPRAVDDAPEAAEVEDEAGAVAAESKPETASARSLTPDEMVGDLRAKIERMGAVNMMAIDQFDDLESRHTFLTAQRRDLVDSIAATNEAIKRIDKTTRERFHEAFTVINQNFEQTFTTLFGGGKAGLVLLDESDALESGIDIIAQPPGKRLQSVQLLSGGEKALTAMSLMFAIFKYRPSPFCLLDEIDAPLDDANIGRFVDMLQGMQEHTQFILITHNRKTMEIADRLYGVTMEEPGVSKLISVQLN